MMGPKQQIERKLFYHGLDINERVRADNPLRAVAARIDFEFVRVEVSGLYGEVGNPSVDPVVVLKLMFLLFFEAVRSERQLAGRLSERLDWMWFCGYDLDSELPTHSVLSKARRRWGKELFATFFERVVRQAVEEGLVDGGLLYCDGSLISANASLDSLTISLRLRGGRTYDELEEACDDDDGESPPPGTRVSTTDPDARLMHKNGRTVLGYKDHRVVDDRSGIITATETTDATTPEAEMLIGVLEQHERNTAVAAQTVTADKGYGTAEVYKELQQRQITPCIPHKRTSEAGDGKFRREEFVYDAEKDCYLCPAGQTMTRRGPAGGNRFRYQASAGTCGACPMRERCTGDKRGRLLSRHADQDVIDWADTAVGPGRRRELMRRRKYKMEGSFADAANEHGYKRARWRGLEWATIQNLLIATVQNIRKLVRWATRKAAASASCADSTSKTTIWRVSQRLNRPWTPNPRPIDRQYRRPTAQCLAPTPAACM